MNASTNDLDLYSEPPKSINIQKEAETDREKVELLSNFEELHKELMEELENHELSTNIQCNPISINLFTVQDFPNLPVICKQILFSFVSGFFTSEILSLTPELLSVKTAKSPVCSKFDGRFVMEIIKKQELSDDWKAYKLPLCPIYVYENFL